MPDAMIFLLQLIGYPFNCKRRFLIHYSDTFRVPDMIQVNRLVKHGVT